MLPTVWQPLDEPGVGGRITALAIDPFDPDRVLIGGDLLGIAASSDGGLTWERATGLIGYEVARFTHHPTRPGEVWAGTMSGPHVSFDGGLTWEPRRAGLPEEQQFYYSAPIELVLFDPADEERLLALGGSHREWPSPAIPGSAPEWGAVWESLDGGETWQQIGTVADGTNVVAAAWLDDGSLLAAALDRGVFRSDDGGATWSPSLDGLIHWNVRDLAVVPGSTTVYATLAEGPLTGDNHPPGGVFRSDDGGRTWSSASEGLGARPSPVAEQASRYDAVVVSPVDPDTLWTADLGFGLERVYRSDDGGASWVVELEGDAEVERAYLSKITAEVLVADPATRQLRFLAQAEYVLRRDDAGRWSDVSSTQVNGNWAGTGYSGLVSTDVHISRERGGEILLAGLDGAHLIRSRDGGQSWDRPLLEWDNWGGSQSIAVGGPGDTHIYVALGQFGVFNGIASSVDGGATWRFAEGPAAGLPDRYGIVSSIDDVAVSSDDPNVVAATLNGSVYVSLDAGLTWDERFTGTFRPLEADATGGFVVGDATGLYQFTAGRPLTIIDGAPTVVDTITVDERTGAIYAVRFGINDDVDGYIGRYEDDTWEQLCLDPAACSTGLDRYAAHLAVHPDDSDRLLVTTSDLPFHDRDGGRGVFESLDGGATWTQLGDDLTFPRVTVAEYDPTRDGRVVAGTMGGGFFELPGLPPE